MQYGQYGTGAGSLNTFAHPITVSIAFGLKSAAGQTLLYGEGRIFTAEDWTDSSGAVQHWLGVQVTQAYGAGSVFAATVDYRITDHATVAIDVLKDGLGYKNVAVTFSPSGSASAFWDVTNPNGDQAPSGYYQFRVTATSAYGCDGSSWCQNTMVSNQFLAGCGVPTSVVLHPRPDHGGQPVRPRSARAGSEPQ